jgi:hypothetical protein
MARNLDQRIINSAENYKKSNKNPLLIFKQFLGDIFSIFWGTTKDLHKLGWLTHPSNPQKL